MLFKNVAGYGLTNFEGRPIAIDGLAELDLDEPHDQALVDDGHVVPVSQPESGGNATSPSTVSTAKNDEGVSE
jgi:hypothetical protein